MTRIMTGRTVIKTSESVITAANVIDVLVKARNIHAKNRSDIKYLYEYYKGNQPILSRIKEVRPDICNRVVENHANEIVSFKVGYLCGEPIQYVSRKSDEAIVEQVNRLNELMFDVDKVAQDQEVVEWQMICGTSYRMVIPNESEDDVIPFEMITLDPHDTFVVRSTGFKNEILMGVKQAVLEDKTVYSVYTKNELFVIENDILKYHEPHAMGAVPIFEYPANNARLGSFEIVLPLLDGLNNISSNRLDGMEQLVQAFIKFINCDIDENDFNKFVELGAIKVKSADGQNADVGVVTTELDQSQTQTMKADFYQNILTICGMPNRNGGLSTSDTGSAVLLRDGWSDAEARAKDSENVFKRSEKEMLKLVLKICNELSDFSLGIRDIDFRFTRRNYEAIQSKSQVLISMLNNDKIHPKLAFQSSGLFTDSDSAYTMSMDYYETQNSKQVIDGEAVDNNSDSEVT